MSQLYSNLKFLRYPDRLAAQLDGRMAAPVHVRIKPINHCNHNCWYCAYRAAQLQLGEEMDVKDRLPEDKMAEIVEDVIAMGVKAVTFSGGGEPLLYKSLPAHIERLAQGGVKVASLTNGSALSGRMAEAFARHGTWVRISLDAWDDDSYAAARGIKSGAFTRLVDNIRAFQKLGSACVLGVSFITSQKNYHKLYDVCALMKGLGVNHVKVSAAVVANDVHENNLYHRAIMAGVTEQIERAQTLNDAAFQVLNHYHETEERFEKPYTNCGFMHFLTVIGADQVVYTCQDKAYTDLGALGSIKERSFREFWFSEENRQRITAFDPSVNCRHHCVAHAKNMVLWQARNVDNDHGCFV